MRLEIFYLKHTMNYSINIRGHLLSLEKPVVMGILNVTPDSFFSGSRKQTDEEIAKQANRIIEEGGTIIDVGGFSTRPGAREVSREDEEERLKNALSIVRKERPDAIVSVDTYRPLVARKCIEEWGADIINDVSEGGLMGIANTPIHEEGNMFELVGKLQVPYILMSVRKNLKEMLLYFAQDVQKLRDYGAKDIILDPGFGFAKTMDSNYECMLHLERLKMLELPILVGVSRKDLVFKIVGGDPTTSLNGTTVLNTMALMKGADILRVHDVKAAVEAVKIYNNLVRQEELQSGSED